MREFDGAHFLWNGEHCLHISPGMDAMWHYDHGDMPGSEIDLMNNSMNSKARAFTIADHGRYQIIDRGTFRD